jgi:hypothetical protein
MANQFASCSATSVSVLGLFRKQKLVNEHQNTNTIITSMWKNITILNLSIKHITFKTNTLWPSQIPATSKRPYVAFLNKRQH